MAGDEQPKSPQAIRQDNLSIVCISTFLAVHREGSFAGAARALGINESSVRHNVNALEQWLSKTLFQRGRRLKLAPSGTEFLPIARQINSLLQKAKEPNGLAHLFHLKNLTEEQAMAEANLIEEMPSLRCEFD